MPEDDVILPDDFEETPQAEETQEQPQEQVETVEDTKPTEETNEPVEQPKIKIKYNHEEREVSVEEAAQLAQKGLVFDKAVERAKQEARDAWIAEQGYEWNGKAITTEADYKQALMEKELMDKYQSQNVPDEVIKELIEGKKFRQQYTAKEQEQQEAQRQQAEYQEFLQAFPDVKPETIPQSVWETHLKGVPLKYAYLEHQYNDAQSKLKTYQQNETNQKKAPVRSVTAHGGEDVGSEDDFLRGFNSI